MSHVRVVNSAAAQLGIQVPKRVKGSVSAGLDLKKYEIVNKVRGHPFMTSARRGGGGVGSKEDEVREVAWI